MSNQTNERSFGRRLWWIIRTTIVSMFLMVVLAGLVYGGFLLFTEVQRTYTSLDVRLNTVERNQNLALDEIDNFRRTNPVLEAQLANLDEDVDQMRTRMNQLEEAFTAELNGLDTAINDLEEDADTLVSETAVLGEAIAALQGDISANTADIDALGGELDAVSGSLETLDAGVSDIAASQTELLAALPDAQYVQETLVLFQLWELIGRARLRLLENNIGLAADDVAAAQLRADLALSEMDMAAGDTEAEAEDTGEGEEAAGAAEGALPSEADILAGVASRLALAAANLPDNPDLAAADLEVAWDALDAILVVRLQPELAEVLGPDEGLLVEEDAATAETPADEEGAAEEATDEATDETEEETEETEAEATPEPTGTPAPPTATPEPSPTPSPTPSG